MEDLPLGVVEEKGTGTIKKMFVDDIGSLKVIIISRTIADSRKESAVFRALGATRLDISQIYFVYTMIVALLTALFSITAGLIVVYIADNLLANQITATLRIAMTPKDLATTFHFWTIDWMIIGAVALSIIAAAVLA